MTDEPRPISSDIGLPTERASQSTESVDWSYGRTDGLTNNLSTSTLTSEASVPRGRVQPESASTGGTGGSAGPERHEVLRTGEREPLCWHVRALVKRRDDYTCYACHGRDDLEVDHLKPWSAGGTHDTRNLRAMCAPCNDRKSNFPAPAHIKAVPITVYCLRCRDSNAPTEGATRVWCATCKDTSFDSPMRLAVVQLYLAAHCDQVEHPVGLNRRDAWGMIDWTVTNGWADWRKERRKAREAQIVVDRTPEVTGPRVRPADLMRSAVATQWSERQERIAAEAQARADRAERLSAARAELHPQEAADVR